MTNRFIPYPVIPVRSSWSSGSAKLRATTSIINFGTAQPVGPANGYQQRFVASSRLPVDGMFFQVGVDCAAYRRIEVGGAKVIE